MKLRHKGALKSLRKVTIERPNLLATILIAATKNIVQSDCYTKLLQTHFKVGNVENNTLPESALIFTLGWLWQNEHTDFCIWNWTRHLRNCNWNVYFPRWINRCDDLLIAAFGSNKWDYQKMLAKSVVLFPRFAFPKMHDWCWRKSCRKRVYADVSTGAGILAEHKNKYCAVSFLCLVLKNMANLCKQALMVQWN